MSGSAQQHSGLSRRDLRELRLVEGSEEPARPDDTGVQAQTRQTQGS